jgi:predicted metal-dependent enzyme (double-stranded beta helix superfamily)
MTNYAGLSVAGTYHVSSLVIGQQQSVEPFLTHRLVLDIDHMIASGQPAIHEAVAAILAKGVDKPELLDGLACDSAAEHTTRHLLHEGADHCVVAIVWTPGQMSPIQASPFWSTLGVHTGELVETSFKPRKDPVPGSSALRVTGCRHLRAGMVRSRPGSDTDFRRVANLGDHPAVSVHVYGVAYDRLSPKSNQV